MTSFGLWEYTCDLQATRDAYARIEHGGADACSCNGCRNFAAARLMVFPSGFTAFLECLGVDSTKDFEVYRNGQLSPGIHHYGGWFHFVGTLDRTGDFSPVQFVDGFSAYLTRKCAPNLPALNGMPLVQVEFVAEKVPWVLLEPEPQQNP
jgi:hypothetical protein